MRVRWPLLLLLAFVSCRRDSVLRTIHRVKIVSHPLSSPLNWEHQESSVFIECDDGRRLANEIGLYTASPDFIATSELPAPGVLMLIDTYNCSVTRPLSDSSSDPGTLEWNLRGNFGFFNTRDAAYVIHAKHPPSLEKISEVPWLAVGMPFQKSAWSASGEKVLLKHFTNQQCEWATWSEARGLERFEFSEDVCHAVTHAWRGEMPTVVLADGRVVESLTR